MGSVIGFGVEFSEFLIDLCARPRGIRPVKTDPGGATLQLGGTFQCREGERDPARALLSGSAGVPRP